MIVHHVMTSFTALVGLNQQFQYYAIYSSGIIESTNIPLTFIDLCTYFPVLKERYFPTLSSVNGAVFAISFILATGRRQVGGVRVGGAGGHGRCRCLKLGRDIGGVGRGVSGLGGRFIISVSDAQRLKGGCHFGGAWRVYHRFAASLGTGLGGLHRWLFFVLDSRRCFRRLVKSGRQGAQIILTVIRAVVWCRLRLGQLGRFRRICCFCRFGGIGCLNCFGLTCSSGSLIAGLGCWRRIGCCGLITSPVASLVAG